MILEKATVFLFAILLLVVHIKSEDAEELPAVVIEKIERVSKGNIVLSDEEIKKAAKKLAVYYNVDQENVSSVFEKTYKENAENQKLKRK